MICKMSTAIKLETSERYLLKILMRNEIFIHSMRCLKNSINKTSNFLERIEFFNWIIKSLWFLYMTITSYNDQMFVTSSINS